jgi:hypothetical protein
MPAFFWRYRYVLQLNLLLYVSKIGRSANGMVTIDWHTTYVYVENFIVLATGIPSFFICNVFIIIGGQVDMYSEYYE